MTSRTPIRLTPHRGPLATPSTSPESSPTSSTPPTDISTDLSIALGPTLGVTMLQHRISTPTPSIRHQSRYLFDRRRQQVTYQALFRRSAPLCPLDLVFENLTCSAGELVKTLAGIFMFCLFIWGLLEWSSCASELPNPWIARFPLPSHPRALRCHANPSHCEPGDQQVAVLHFLSEQIQHAKALSSLSVGLGPPLRAFLEANRATIPKVIARRNSAEVLLVQEVDTLANLTELFDPNLLDFTPGSFIGRSFSLALEEFGDFISEPMVSYGSGRHGEHQNARLQAIYWRTASNLLLEYSAARPRARRLLRHLYALRHQLSPLGSNHHAGRGIEGRLKIWWWNGVIRHPATSTEGEMPAFVTGLEVTLDNVHRLSAYLDWITERLARMTLGDALKIHRRTDFLSCMTSLQELFAQAKPSASTKRCLCLNDNRITPPNQPERVEIMVPGSPTVRAER